MLILDWRWISLNINDRCVRDDDEEGEDKEIRISARSPNRTNTEI